MSDDRQNYDPEMGYYDECEHNKNPYKCEICGIQRKKENPVQKKLNDLNAKWWTYWKEVYQPLVERINFIEAWALESYKQRQVLPFEKHPNYYDPGDFRLLYGACLKEKVKLRSMIVDLNKEIKRLKSENEDKPTKEGWDKYHITEPYIRNVKIEKPKEIKKKAKLIVGPLGPRICDREYLCMSEYQCPLQENFESITGHRDALAKNVIRLVNEKKALTETLESFVKEKESKSEIKCPKCDGFVMWIVKEEMCLCMDCQHKFVHPNRKFEFPEKTIEWMVDRTLGCNSELHDKLLEAMQLKDFNKMNRWFGYYQRFGECEGYWSLDEIIEMVRNERDEYGTVSK